jgi:site-specific recombinase XerD
MSNAAAATVIQLRSPSGLLSDFGMYRDFLLGKQRSPRTIESYLDAVTQLDRFLTDREHSRRTEDVIRADVLAFLAAMTERYAPGTVSIRFNSIRAFFSWASQEDGGDIATAASRSRCMS